MSASMSMSAAEPGATAAPGANVRTSLVWPRIVRVQVLVGEVAPSGAAVESSSASTPEPASEAPATKTTPEPSPTATHPAAEPAWPRKSGVTVLRVKDEHEQRRCKRTCVPLALRECVRTSLCHDTYLHRRVRKGHAKIRKQLTNSRSGIFRRLEDDGARALGASVRTEVDISAHDVTGNAEEVLEVLPTRLIRKLRKMCDFGAENERREENTLPT